MTTAPIGRDDFDALVAKLDLILETVAKPTAQLLDQPAAMGYCGLKRSGWFRLKSAGLLPKPLTLEGSGERWRRADLDRWIAAMKPRRK